MPFIVAHPLHLFLASVKRLTHLSRFPLLKFAPSPTCSTREDIRRFQLHLAETGMSICNRNRIMTGVREVLLRSWLELKGVGKPNRARRDGLRG
jgi:hypothetical protein